MTEDVFGMYNRDGTRQYRTVYVEVPKKNGKTTWAAAIAAYLLKEDGEPGCEVYCAAYDKEQAGITFRTASAMLKRMAKNGYRERYKGLRFQDYRKTILDEANNGLLRALEREAKGQHGWNIHGLIFDEFHTQRSPELWDTLREGTASREQPLTFIITTAGFDRQSPCWRLHEYARKVMADPSIDPSFYPVIYSAADDDEWEAFDWMDEARMRRANPSLGVTVQLEEMRRAAKRAQQIPTEQNTFKRLRLNIWTQAQTRYLPGELWDQCVGDVNEDDLIGARCFAGLDLASTQDVAAFVMLFPTTGGLKILPRFWIPRDTITKRSRDDGVPYEWWAAQGFVTATAGNAADYDAIEQEIKRLSERHQIEMVGYDAWNAEQMAQRLTKHGMQMVKLPQTCAYMNQATKTLLKLVLSRDIQHGANPPLRWMMDNLMVIQDANGNMKPDKAKSTEKIDGMVALIMAIDMWLRFGSVEKAEWALI